MIVFYAEPIEQERTFASLVGRAGLPVVDRAELPLKRCKECGGEFRQFSSLQNCCSSRCANAYAMARKERRANRAPKPDLFPNDFKHQLKLTQETFNKWIRTRDANLPCVSCGEEMGAEVCAGHYRSVGSQPALRFNLWNVHGQCEECNSGKSGNRTGYRLGLIDRIGGGLVDYLDLEHKPRQYTTLQVISLRKYFNQLIKSI